MILSNQAMDEGRKVYFNEIEKMGPGHRTSRQEAVAAIPAAFRQVSKNPRVPAQTAWPRATN